jgi:hypothetical protein
MFPMSERDLVNINTNTLVLPILLRQLTVDGNPIRNPSAIAPKLPKTLQEHTAVGTGKVLTRGELRTRFDSSSLVRMLSARCRDAD